MSAGLVDIDAIASITSIFIYHMRFEVLSKSYDFRVGKQVLNCLVVKTI